MLESLPTDFRKLWAQRRIVDELLNSLTNGGNGIGIDEQGCMGCNLLHGGDLAGDHGFTRCKCFDHRQSESLISRGKQNKICIVVFHQEFFLGDAEDIRVVDPVFLQEFYLSTFQFTDDSEVNWQLIECCDGQLQVFIGLGAEEEELEGRGIDSWGRGTRERGRGLYGSEQRINGIGDDDDLVGITCGVIKDFLSGFFGDGGDVEGFANRQIQVEPFQDCSGGSLIGMEEYQIMDCEYRSLRW